MDINYEKEIKDSVSDWSEACRWVERAVRLEADRILSEGGYGPDAQVKSDKLRAAWLRILQG